MVVSVYHLGDPISMGLPGSVIHDHIDVAMLLLILEAVCPEQDGKHKKCHIGLEQRSNPLSYLQQQQVVDVLEPYQMLHLWRN